MEIEFEGVTIEVEVYQYSYSKTRHGAYTVSDEHIALKYDLPKGIDSELFEDFVHANHIETLIEIYQNQ